MKNRGRWFFFMGGNRDGLSVYSLLLISLLFAVVSPARAELGPENLLILVNADSATSQYVAKMYREYYPAISGNQVLELTGLADCSGPGSTAADEIITRTQYNTLIAEPVRQHLLDNNLIQQIMVIVTTAGMPYRIEDTTYADVVYPAGSNDNRVSQNCAQITAASVESELTCLWYADAFGLANRMVNPYQGYRGSSITLFERSVPGMKTMNWTTAMTVSGTAPKMEGVFDWSILPMPFGTADRAFSAGDIYLTCRLDGPKPEGKSAVFAVRELLGRSQRASDPASGVDPLTSVAVIDDAPGKHLDANRIYNLDSSMQYYVYDPETPQPPDASTVLTLDDYSTSYEVISQDGFSDNMINVGYMDAAYGMKVLFDRRNGLRMSQSDLDLNENLLFLCCFGRNGDEGSQSDYLLTGLGGASLFDLANGAVFTSIESFNATTMFSNMQTAPTAQGKIVDFIAIGGSGAIGHAFEPMSSAVVDNVYVAYNMLADSDLDNRADVTFVEAAWSGIPFLSWTEVVIGDPLMRIAYGPGEPEAWTPFYGDVNSDGAVNIRDYVYLRNLIKQAGNPSLYDSIPEKREQYKDLCDLNQDEYNNIRDIVALRNLLYSQ